VTLADRILAALAGGPLAARPLAAALDLDPDAWRDVLDPLAELGRASLTERASETPEDQRVGPGSTIRYQLTRLGRMAADDLTDDAPEPFDPPHHDPRESSTDHAARSRREREQRAAAAELDDEPEPEPPLSSQERRKRARARASELRAARKVRRAIEAHPARAVACTHCGAGIGSPCMRPSGHAVFGGGSHADRMSAAGLASAPAVMAELHAEDATDNTLF
jgi:hypothetical protein